MRDVHRAYKKSVNLNETMISPRKQIIELIEQQAIPPEKTSDALAVANIFPNGKAWQTFIDHLLLWVGGLALAFSGLFFIAYNWSDIGRLAKFGLVELFMVLAIIVFWKQGETKVSGKISLVVATIFLGVLLALYGQTYQTGADTWQLFFNWALMMLPWAMIARFAVIWVIWIVLINLSIILYHQTFGGIFLLLVDSDTEILWLLFFFNTLALATWEYLSKTWRWLAKYWAIRLLAVSSGVPITWLVLHAIFDPVGSNFLSGLVWMIWLSVLYYFYRRIKTDLFMLAGGCLSGIVVLITLMSKQMLNDWSAGSFLILFFMVISLGAGAAVWLRNVYQEWHS